MKRIMLALLLTPAVTFAQKKDAIYADIALTETGGSLTYDRVLTRHFALGGGVDLYDWHAGRMNVRTAVYIDARPNWRFGRSSIFVPIDLGWAFYNGHELSSDTVTFSSNGFYLSFGVGYSYRLTKRGGGPYITLMSKGYSYTESGYDRLHQKYESGIHDASSLLSVGFKF